LRVLFNETQKLIYKTIIGALIDYNKLIDGIAALNAYSNRGNHKKNE
jgi:hypothetical protein